MWFCCIAANALWSTFLYNLYSMILNCYDPLHQAEFSSVFFVFFVYCYPSFIILFSHYHVFLFFIIPPYGDMEELLCLFSFSEARGSIYTRVQILQLFPLPSSPIFLSSFFSFYSLVVICYKSLLSLFFSPHSSHLPSQSFFLFLLGHHKFLSFIRLPNFHPSPLFSGPSP